MTLNVAPSACIHDRCRRAVLRVQVFKQSGAPVDEILDAQPVKWEDGGRYKLMSSAHLPPGRQLVQRLTTAARAFGATLYRPHREVCEIAPRRTRQKTAKGVGS